jgi:hypothetical protein
VTNRWALSRRNKPRRAIIHHERSWKSALTLDNQAFLWETFVSAIGALDPVRSPNHSVAKPERQMAKSNQGTAPLKVLFIGNSFTARNNLPAMIAELAAARGITMQHRLISAGGASLRRHWNGGEAPQAIEDGHYDYVVLQEQSTLPVKNAKRMHENVRLFAEPIKAARAKMVLYMTWARRTTPDSQQAITDAYNSIGQELVATVIPVGVAWQSFLGSHDQPVLHDRDGSHPTIAGSYLAACTFLAVLFNENPIGIESDIAGLDAGHRNLLQKTAWQARNSITAQRTK